MFVPLGDVYSLIQEALARVVVEQVQEGDLSHDQAVSLVESALDVFQTVTGGLLHLERREIPTPRRGIPEAVRERIYARDNHRCLSCGSEENLTVDHVIPLDVGGRHAEDNFQTLCGPCNSRKATTAIDYRLDQ